MSVKENVLKTLLNADSPVSGELLAKSLNVSRNAVWKAINSLKSDGYDISGVSNSGYTLSYGDVMSLAELKIYLGENRTVEVYDSIGSTNTRAKELALSGAASGSIVVAKNQLEGRGRLGRHFHCETGGGLYMSIILRPDATMDENLKITAYAGVAAAEAIESLVKCDVKIKWVNDLFLNGKKICGILTEGSTNLENGQLEYAVVGIGINTGKMLFPPELSDIATSVFNETGVLISRSRLAYEIVKRLENADDSYMKKYRDRSCVIGKTARVRCGNRQFEAEITGIDQNGFLVVNADGEKFTVNSGEVIMK